MHSPVGAFHGGFTPLPIPLSCPICLLLDLGWLNIPPFLLLLSKLTRHPFLPYVPLRPRYDRPPLDRLVNSFTR